MVFLHELERGTIETRPTDDVDVVVDLRAEPAGLARIHSALLDAGFEQDAPGPEGTAHRYRRDTAVIDVLAPITSASEHSSAWVLVARSKHRERPKRSAAAR
jgi:hypothetical protein